MNIFLKPRDEGQTTLSHMSTKGWHYDVTDEQIEAAQEALKALVDPNTPVYYTEEPDPYTSKRYFWSSLGWEEPRDLACFDQFGNLIIYAATLGVKTQARATNSNA